MFKIGPLSSGCLVYDGQSRGSSGIVMCFGRFFMFVFKFIFFIVVIIILMTSSLPFM